MILRECVCKNIEKINDTDKILQRLIHDALYNEDTDEFQRACEKVYNHYYDSLYTIAYYSLNDRNDAEDLVLDTFEELFRSILLRKDIECLKSYMWSIFIFNCYDMNKSERRRKRFVRIVDNTEELADSNRIVSDLEIEDLLNTYLNEIEMYIVVHHVIKDESILKIKSDLKLENVDVYKMFKKAIKKLQKGVVNKNGRKEFNY